MQAAHTRCPTAQPAGPVRTVVSVDTHPLVRLGVAEIAERCPDLRLVGQAATGEEARELVARTRPDVVVIGDTLPAGGRALAAELRAAQPALGLVSLSGQTDPAALRRGREAGLSALVARSARIPVVAAAIRHAATEPGALRGFGTPVDPGTGPAPVLSRREEQVLALIGDGLSNEDIAATLRVGRGTVRTYVTRLLAKLHARSRSQAVVAARSLPVGAG